MNQHLFHQFVVPPDTSKDRVVVILDAGGSTYYLLDDLTVIESIALLLQKPAVFFLLPAHSFAVVDVFKKTADECKKCCDSDEKSKTESIAVQPMFVFGYEVFNSSSLFEPDELMKKLIESDKRDAELESTITIKYKIPPAKCPVEDCPTTVHHTPCYYGQVGACDKDGEGNPKPDCVAGGG